MTVLKTATGRELVCAAVSRGQMYPYLYIHTAALSWEEAYAFFTDKTGLAKLTTVESFTFPAQTEQGAQDIEAETTHVYNGFTELYCIQRSPLMDDPGALMIWLQRPESED